MTIQELFDTVIVWCAFREIDPAQLDINYIDLSAVVDPDDLVIELSDMDTVEIWN